MILSTRCTGEQLRAGQNLVMTGADSLGGDTDTSVVSQRSEEGPGILGVKTGTGKYHILYVVVFVEVLSPLRSVGRDTFKPGKA